LLWAALERELASGLKPEVPVDRVGLNAGFEAIGGGGPDDEGAAPLDEYFAPEASATF